MQKIKVKNKNLFGINISEEDFKAAKESFIDPIKILSIPDMFCILLHNQTIINSKLNNLLNKKNEQRRKKK